jgi:S1-C subfamily serine protease
VGSPMGLQGTVTTGIISALNRAVSAVVADAANRPAAIDAIQTDAPINPGSSVPQVAGRSMRVRHIAVSRGKVARAISTQGRNLRLDIWLAGWHIEIYDEFGEQSHLFVAR